MNSKVSIITPTYNHSTFIEKCIESVMNQTYTNWEQIIVDDGSSDNTIQIIKIKLKTIKDLY
ncbi:MAG: glycosyltransferase [Saprospiraceae bacterium]|nr:glycosyltransferase [Saprospiraceae bacterium]